MRMKLVEVGGVAPRSERGGSKIGGKQRREWEIFPLTVGNLTEQIRLVAWLLGPL